MKLFFTIIKQKWNDYKIRLHLAFVYPYKKNFSKIKSIIPATIRIGEGIIIEKDVSIQPHVKEIGKYVYIGNHTHIGLCKSIGSFSSISFGVKIGLRDHPLDYVSTSPVFYGASRGWVKENRFQNTKDLLVEIGYDVLISANVVVLEGVKIGTGAVIGAGAVVTKDVEPYAIVGGVPAKLIRYRFDEGLRAQLLASNWWELDDLKLKKRIDFANNPQQFLDSLKAE